MKGRYILGLLLIISGYFIVDNLLVSNKENDSVETDVTYVKHENALSMMLETESGSGEYTLETRSSWPTQEDGYIFNSTLSKCENGSKLSWDNDNNAVIMTGNVSDKCYVYFDVYLEQTVIDVDETYYFRSYYDFEVEAKDGGESIKVVDISGDYTVNVFNLYYLSGWDIENTMTSDYCKNPISNVGINAKCYTSTLFELNTYGFKGWDYFVATIDYDTDGIYGRAIGDGGEYAIQFIEDGKLPSDWYYIKFFIQCLSENTEIYVYDKKKQKFKKKKIGDIDYDDEILCWDFDNGKFTKAKPIWIMKKKTTNKYNLLKFDDGSTLETIEQHRIFNKEKGKFTYPMTSDTPIGTTTFNSKGEYVKLVSKEIVEEPINYYNIITGKHLNMFANGILTSCRLSNMYPIEDMKYVYDKKRDNGIDFSEFDENLVKELRLKEQDIKECELKEYVDNMLKTML